MPDIIENVTTGQKSERVRAVAVNITTPLIGERVIEFPSERLLLLDGEVIGTKPQGAIVRNFSDVMTQTVSIADPVTGQSITISVAGIAMAIADRYETWYREQTGG